MRDMMCLCFELQPRPSILRYTLSNRDRQRQSQISACQSYSLAVLQMHGSVSHQHLRTVASVLEGWMNRYVDRTCSRRNGPMADVPGWSENAT